MTDILLTHRGVIAATDEEFVHTLTVQTAASDRALIAADARAAFQTAWNAAGTTFTAAFGNATDYVDVGAAEILDLSGGSLSPATRDPFAVPVPSGTSATGALQLATAVSLRAGVRANGAPLRGRFYLPTNSTSIATAGLLSSVTQTAIADFVVAWFAELAARGLAPSVWSRGSQVPIPPVAPFINPIEEIRVGRVVDTIRSRRNGLPETPYAIRAIPVA